MRELASSSIFRLLPRFKGYHGCNFLCFKANRGKVVKQRYSVVLRLDRKAPFCEGLGGYFIQLMAGVRIWV